MIFGKTVRTLPTPGNKVLYLTFDDGPSPGCTELVLDLLAEHKASATFFVIGKKAQREKKLLQKIQEQGHAVADHSWDHGYVNFFLGINSNFQWIKKSQDNLKRLINTNLITCFRPPAGIRTPLLHVALRRLNLPLVLWNIRFFDTTFPDFGQRGIRALQKAKSGSIVLLHDSHEGQNRKHFLKSLDIFITEAKARGFALRTLENISS